MRIRIGKRQTIETLINEACMHNPNAQSIFEKIRIVSKDNIMSTKIHDEMIEEAVGWAKSLGYGVVEYNLGTNTGADAIFENRFGEKAILEIVTGASFRELFKKSRIREGFEEDEKWGMVPEILGLIVVGDRIENVEKHGTEVGIPKGLFNPPDQKIFAVLTRHFKEVIPVLLVSILGSRASAYARVSP